MTDRKCDNVLCGWCYFHRSTKCGMNTSSCRPERCECVRQAVIDRIREARISKEVKPRKRPVRKHADGVWLVHGHRNGVSRIIGRADSKIGARAIMRQELKSGHSDSVFAVDPNTKVAYDMKGVAKTMLVDAPGGMRITTDEWAKACEPLPRGEDGE